MRNELIEQKPPTLAIIVPCFNEAQVVQTTAEHLWGVLDSLIAKGKIAATSFVCLIDDGSWDNTWEQIQNLHLRNKLFKGVKLSRNFGHQNALFCGFINTQQLVDCVISMDADLQDDVLVIEKFIDCFRDGFDIVYGVRKERKFDGPFKKMSATLFYKLMRLLGVEIIPNHGDFRLVSKKIIMHLANFAEFNLFLRGLFPLIGFKSTVVYYDRGSRMNGKSKYSLSKMFAFSLDGITSLSVAPLRLISLLGLLIFISSLFASGYILLCRLLAAEMVPAWALTILPIYFIGGVQLLSIGVLGEYIGKIYKETKARPRYIIEEEVL